MFDFKKKYNLIELSNDIKNFILEKNQNDKKLFEQLQINITYASQGNLQGKNNLKKEILDYIKENVKENSINELISQYHINYFEKIYDGNNTEIASVINNNLTIKEDDDIEIRQEKLSQIIYQDLYGVSVIDDFYYGNIEGVNEISCNDFNYISMQILGIKIHLPKLVFKDKDFFAEIIKKAISFDGKQDLKIDCPEILCQAINGARITALCPPYSNSYSLNVRFFDDKFSNKDVLIKKGSSTKDIEDFLDNILPGRINIFVLGDQGTGKTTRLLRLIGSLPDNLAIATMETMFELNIPKRFPGKDVKELQFTVNKGPEEAFETCLRLNRDLIVNGEIRTSEEANVTLKAMTRQGRGSLASFHTTSAQDFMYDYKNLVMKKGNYFSEESALFDIARAADILILLGIDRKTGYRYTKEIVEVELDLNNPSKPFRLNTIVKYNKKTNKMEFINRLSEELIQRATEYDFDEENLENINKIYEKNNI